MKKIILTGGGTAGHVTPNIALIPKLKKTGYKISYIGSKTGMEKELIEECKIDYYGISAGKLRRYLDFKNFTDAGAVIKGCTEAVSVIKKEKPDVIFSKGGFVTVPVVIAAKICGVPVVLHESDITPGLANKLSLPFANIICCAFPETAQKMPKGKAVVTGTPIREQLFWGDKARGLRACEFNSEKPVILVMGGSSGSLKINACIRQALGKLLKSYQVAHICGKANVDKDIRLLGYKQFEYISSELPHIIAAADIVVSRAGANSIFEFLALKKPNLLIPLSRKASRGDQILNAESFKAKGFSKVLLENEMSADSLVTEIIDLYACRDQYISEMSVSSLSNGVDEVCKIINGIR